MEQLLKDPENQPPDLRADILQGLDSCVVVNAMKRL